MWIWVAQLKPSFNSLFSLITSWIRKAPRPKRVHTHLYVKFRYPIMHPKSKKFISLTQPLERWTSTTVCRQILALLSWAFLGLPWVRTHDLLPVLILLKLATEKWIAEELLQFPCDLMRAHIIWLEIHHLTVLV